MTKQLDQSDLVPGRGDKLTAQAYNRMIEAFQQGNTTEAAREAVRVDISKLDPEKVQEYQQVIQQIQALDSQAAAIIARADSHTPREGTARSRIEQRRRGQGAFHGIPRIWLGAGIGLLVLGLAFSIGLFLLGRSSAGGGGSAAVNPTAANPTAAPTAPPAGAGIGTTGSISGTGSVLLTGDMKLKLKANGGEADLTPATMADGQFSMGDKVIGTISTDLASGGKRLSFNGTVAVTVRLFKVDPSLAPVWFTIGDRSFNVLAQLDGRYRLVVMKDGAEQPAEFSTPPDGIGMLGYPVIATADAGDCIELTFPAKPDQPAGNG